MTQYVSVIKSAYCMVQCVSDTIPVLFV